MKDNLIEDNKIIMYKTDGGQVEIEVHLEDENVWFTQNLMAKTIWYNKAKYKFRYKKYI